MSTIKKYQNSQKLCSYDKLLSIRFAWAIFLLVPFAFRFFDFILLRDYAPYVRQIIGFPILLYAIIKCFFKRNIFHIPYYGLIKILLSITLFSIVMSLMLHDQNPFDSLVGIVGQGVAFTFLIVFFFEIRPDPNSFEILIFFLGFVFCCLWLLSYSVAPIVLFSESDELNIRGVYRILFTGRAMLVFSFFLSANKFVTKKKIIYLVLTVIFFAFIALQSTRQLLFFSFIVAFFYLLKYLRKFRWALIFLLLLAPLKNIQFSEDSVLGAMFHRSQTQFEQNESGDTYIRIKEYDFYFFDYFPNPIGDLLGNGFAGNNSDFGKSSEILEKSHDASLTDAGYARMKVTVGWVGLFIYLFLFIRLSVQKVRSEHMYAKLFVIYTIFANSMADWYVKPDHALALCICIYILSCDKLEERFGRLKSL